MRKTKATQAVERANRPQLKSSDFLHGVEHFWLDNLERPIEVMAASVVGIVGISEDADDEVYPLDKPVLINSDKLVAKAGTGFLANALEDIYRQGGALCVVVRVSPESSEGVHPVVGTVDEDGHAFGLQALLGAESAVGVRPTLLMLATGDEDDLETEVPALCVVANKLHAIPVISRQTGGPQAAMKAAEATDGVEFVYGTFYFGKDGLGNPIYRPAAATVVGHIIRIDREEGYWNSPSSRQILGVSGMKVTVDHVPGSTTCTSNLLNSKGVSCVIQQDGGFYFWGNRLTGPKLEVLPHKRIRYIVGMSIMKAHQELQDRNLTGNYVEGVKGRVNNLIKRLVLRQVISGGVCWVDKELNTSLIGTNSCVWDYDLGFFDIAERCTFRQHINNSYNEAIFA